MLFLQIMKIAFVFTATNLHNILNFEFILLGDEAKLINFPITENKVPVLNFTIQVVRWCE